MSKHLFLFCLLCAFLVNNTFAQNEKKYIRYNITTLSGASMHGRGYVSKGGEKAAGYIKRNLAELGLLPFNKDSTYFQKYAFPVNTFPGKMSLTINKTELKPGADFIIHAGSSAYRNADRSKLRRIDLGKVKDTLSWAKVKAKMKPGSAYYLTHADTASKYLSSSIRGIAKELPKGLYIIPQHGKLTWTVSTDTIPATVFYVEDTVLPNHPHKAMAEVETKYLNSYPNQNVAAYVPGTMHPDSFIVFSAHYDHLGMMGKFTMFPGAHDNASGTSLVLYLASYFAKHPQKYSIAFLLFSGEEAGLLGSDYYVHHPLFPLSQIRFVVNLDMTGDAKDGITVVNADTRVTEFKMLERINKKDSYLPAIKQRSQTRNSDHYSFSKEGVPAIFIYGNGTKPYYHDVFDTVKELSLDHIDDLAKLLIHFTGELTGDIKTAE